MRQRIRPDIGLSVRMFLTMLLLAALYLFFLVVLWKAGADAMTMLIFVGVMLFIQYFYSDKLILLSMGAREVSSREAPELHDMVSRLAAMANLPKPKVAMVHTPIPNAFATGRGPNHAVVAVTTGLLDRLDPDEVEAVLAHEMTHIRNHDMTVITLASFFATVASFLMRRAFYWGVPRGRDRENNSAALLYVVAMVVWVISYFLIRALSRYREYAADRGAAILTGAPSALASALVKISGVMERIPTRDLREAEALNAFYIIPAAASGSFMELFSTHPSLKNRINHLKKLQQTIDGKR